MWELKSIYFLFQHCVSDQFNAHIREGVVPLPRRASVLRPDYFDLAISRHLGRCSYYLSGDLYLNRWVISLHFSL